METVAVCRRLSSACRHARARTSPASRVFSNQRSVSFDYSGSRLPAWMPTDVNFHQGAREASPPSLSARLPPPLVKVNLASVAVTGRPPPSPLPHLPHRLLIASLPLWSCLQLQCVRNLCNIWIDNLVPPRSPFVSRFYSEKAFTHWKFIQGKYFLPSDFICKVPLKKKNPYLFCQDSLTFALCFIRDDMPPPPPPSRPDPLRGDPPLPAVAAGAEGQLCRGAVPHLCLSGPGIPCGALLQRALHPGHHHLQPLLHSLRRCVCFLNRSNALTSRRFAVWEAVPVAGFVGFPPKSVCWNAFACVSLSLGTAKVVPEEITPLVPAVAGEKVADDQTCFILETLLKYMVIQVRVNNGRRKSDCGLQQACVIHIVKEPAVCFSK